MWFPSRCLGAVPLVFACVSVAAQTKQFAQLPGFEMPSIGNGSASFVVGDLDGDGADDVIAGVRETFLFYALPGQNRVFLSDGRGRLRDATPTHFPVTKDVTTAIALGDIDGDGDLDLMVGNSRTLPGLGKDRLYTNDGRGRFTEVTATHLPRQVEDSTVGLAFVDVDGDTDLDLYSSKRNVDAQLYLNDGRGRFTHSPNRLPPGIWTVPYPDDVDGDGDLDILTFGLKPRLLVNDGKGRFALSTVALPEHHQGDRACLADFDGDGDNDVMIGMHARPRYWLNVGGRFQKAPADRLPPIVNPSPNNLAAVDVDLDGHVDVLTRGSASIGYLRNDGRGGFASEVARMPSRLTPLEFAVGDFDRDGDVDIAYSRNDTVRGPTRVLLNLHRQVVATSPPVLGKSYGLHVAVQPGYSRQNRAIPFLSLATLARAFRVAPYGHVGLDPRSLWMTAPIALPSPFGIKTVEIPIPNDSNLRGTTLAAQVLAMHGLGRDSWRLTNVFAEKIR